MKNKHLWQKRWFQFFHCELSIYMYIPVATAYGVYMYNVHVYRYLSADPIFQSLCMWFICDFLDRGLMLTRKLLNQGLVVNLKSLLRKFYSRHHDLVIRHGVSVLQMTTFVVITIWSFYPFVTYHWVCNKNNKTGTTCWAGTDNPFRAPEFTPIFQWGSCF